MVSEIESCFTDTEAYNDASCTSGAGTGLPVGSGTGQVQITATSNTYTIVGHSKSKNNFTITKASDGTTTRSCDTAGTDKGGCSGGSW
jgi:hypothetical protein